MDDRSKRTAQERRNIELEVSRCPPQQQRGKFLAKASPKDNSAWFVATICALLCALIWLNESIDIPYLLLGAEATPLNWREALIESGLVVAVGLLATMRLARDFYERARVGEELRASEQRLFQIVQGSSVATFVIDREHIISHWNKACENLTGLSADEMCGTRRQWMAFYPVERAVMADLLVDGAPEEEIAAHYSGKYRPSAVMEGAYEAEDFFPHLGEGGKWLFSGTAPLRDGAGKITGAIETLQDITERKRIEGRLREAHKMEAIGQLAGGMAHQFNNLLTVVNGYSELLAMDLQAGHPAHAQISEIAKAGKRAADLTRKLLAFSRRQMLAMQPLNLNDILSDMTDMLRSLLHGDIALTMSLADDLGTALVDREQIIQIMLALVTNAGDAMPDGGALTIKTANLKLAEPHLNNSFDLSASRYVLLEISDTGVGMSTEVQAHLFEPFFSTKGLAVGTGLGLASVYGIVKQFGGEIEVQSEEGQGTVFTIYLPNIDADS